MKSMLSLIIAAILMINFVGCATPAEVRRRDAQRAREDARRDAERRREDVRWEAEHRQRDRERNARDYQDFLISFARSLGKVPEELNAVQRAEARREFRDGRRY